MHEMTLTRDVVDLVIENARAVGAVKVKSVHLTIGYVRDIVEELFEGCFAYMARGTEAEGAELVITRVPFRVKCNRCEQIYHLNIRDKTAWGCPKCNKRDYRLHSGMEFFVNFIEIEELSSQRKASTSKFGSEHAFKEEMQYV